MIKINKRNTKKIQKMKNKKIKNEIKLNEIVGMQICGSFLIKHDIVLLCETWSQNVYTPELDGFVYVGVYLKYRQKMHVGMREGLESLYEKKYTLRE